MKLLHISWRWPNCSETYIRHEQEYLLKKGVDVQTFAFTCGPGSSPSKVHNFRDEFTLPRVVASESPDLLLFHNPQVAWSARQLAPFILRLHGCEGNYHASFKEEACDIQKHLQIVKQLSAHPNCRGIFAFPSVAKKHSFTPLPLMFRPLPRTPNKNKRLVVRLGAVKASKELHTVVEISRLCPEFQFRIAAATGYDLENGLKLISEIPFSNNVLIKTDVSEGEANEWIKEAGIYIHTYPKCDIGLSISPFEAASTGAYVLSPYLFDTYVDVGEAAAKIRGTLGWDDIRWSSTSFLNHQISGIYDIERWGPYYLSLLHKAVEVPLMPPTIL